MPREVFLGEQDNALRSAAFMHAMQPLFMKIGNTFLNVNEIRKVKVTVIVDQTLYHVTERDAYVEHEVTLEQLRDVRTLSGWFR